MSISCSTVYSCFNVLKLLCERWWGAHEPTLRALRAGDGLGGSVLFPSALLRQHHWVLHATQPINSQVILWDWTHGKWLYLQSSCWLLCQMVTLGYPERQSENSSWEWSHAVVVWASWADSEVRASLRATVKGRTAQRKHDRFSSVPVHHLALSVSTECYSFIGCLKVKGCDFRALHVDHWSCICFHDRLLLKYDHICFKNWSKINKSQHYSMIQQCITGNILSVTGH